MLKQAAEWIRESRYVVAFTGAGISVDSGLPSFADWPGFNPYIMDLNYFGGQPQQSWQMMKDFIYDRYAEAQPNDGHRALAEMQAAGLIKSIVTLNIDGLHRKAGSKKVVEICGTLSRLVCMNCQQKYMTDEVSLTELPPLCPQCGGLLKPDILFYNDLAPDPEYKNGLREANRARLLLVVGVSGEMMPAGLIPMFAKRRRQTKIIEINPRKTRYSDDVSDVFIQQPASMALKNLLAALRD